MCALEGAWAVYDAIFSRSSIKYLHTIRDDADVCQGPGLEEESSLFLMELL